MEEQKIISFKHQVYNKIFETIAENTKSFRLITKKLVSRPDSLPMIYVGITDSTSNELQQSVRAEILNFDIIIMANNPPEDYNFSGNEVLLELESEVEYALAKPVNWNTNHLGFPGRVKNCMITDSRYYDDESAGEGNIACILTVTVTLVGQSVLRPPAPQKLG